MKKRYIVLLIIFLILMIASIISLLIWNKYNNKNKEIVKKEEKFLIKEEEETYQLDKEIKKDNKNTVGWLIVEGTNINYPVVQYTDNSYYLNHDFNNEYNTAGWIFMDYRNNLEDQNIVIYGHHRIDGSMFGSIDSLFNKENHKILFITEEGTNEYEIFSVYKTSGDEIYNNNNYENFEEEINKLKAKSEIKFENKEINYQQIITLSTCHKNNKDRLVVHGYRKR